MTTYHIFALIVVIILSLIHYVNERLAESGWVFHRKFLSFAGGVSVSYVFIELLPNLNKAQETIQQSSIGLIPFLEKHVYVFALIGLLVFYSVEQINHRSKDLFQSLTPFWLSIFSYGTFNFIVGYAVSDQYDPEIRPLALFTIAMGLHLFINDYNLFQLHHNAYQQLGRALLVSALAFGWMIGLAIELPAAFIAILVAFMSGGMIMNVLHNELPSGYKKNALRSFIFGAVLYTIILLLLGQTYSSQYW